MRAIDGYLHMLSPMKSGSSWLAHALSIRPFFDFPREFDFIFFLRYPLSKQWNIETAKDPKFLQIRRDANLTEDEKLIALYKHEREKHPSNTILIDKAPSNLYSGFEDFRHLYSQQRIILLYRDPRDIYISNEFFQQRELMNKPIRDDIGDAKYIQNNDIFHGAFTVSQMLLRIERLLLEEGFRCFRLTYEELKANFREKLMALLEFLELDLAPDDLVTSHYIPEPIPLSKHIAEAEHFKPLFRKGIAGDWKNHLVSPDAKDIIKQHSGELLIELGYEIDLDW
jgi:hypothetical protein